MSASACQPCNCPDPVITQIPGVEGAAGEAGTDGTDGVNAFTETTNLFVVPPIGNDVTVFVESTEWMAVGQSIFISTAGYFTVSSIPSDLAVVLTYADFTSNVAAGNSIAAGSAVSPGGTEPSLAGVTALTNNTGGTVSNVLGATAGIYVLPLSISLVQIVGAGDVLTTYTPGHAFKILAVDARVSEVVVTAGDAASLNLEIGATNLTGGVVALTSANCTPLGAVIAGSAVTAANVGTAADTISVEAASVTAFAEGEVILLVRIQNLDTLAALSSLAAKTNEILTALS